MELLEGVKYGGLFRIDGQDRTGELTLSGGETNLYVHDPEFFRPDVIENRFIPGVLHDRSRVSLLQCNAPSLTGSAMVCDEGYEFANIFPHYVLHGYQHLGPLDHDVRSIRFVTDDATTIFYDFDAFARVLTPERHIAALVESNAQRVGRDITVGDEPDITYFTGKRQIFTADTALGKVSASHNPRSNWGGPDGVLIKNLISLDVSFPEPVAFQDALEAVSTLLLFLELVAGRRQNVKSVGVIVDSAENPTAHLNLYWSMPPRRESDLESRRPQPGDLPLNGGMKPEAFATVLKQWLRRHDTWGDARIRFSSSFSQQNSFSVERLIGSANVFDLLPSSAAPKTAQLSPELKDATDRAKKLFRSLPGSPQRDGVLDALGRVGRLSLRDKIQLRA